MNSNHFGNVLGDRAEVIILHDKVQMKSYQPVAVLQESRNWQP